MDKVFNLKANGTTIGREFIAGLTTFLTMAYILAVNPGMLGSIGNGMTPGAVFTATIVASIIAMVIMAFSANLPVALAPGMGLNAFFTYTVVFDMGYSWQMALAAVFCEGVIFIILSFFNVREAIVKAIPENLKKAVAVGIGFFIALIGFKSGGIVIPNEATLISLGNVKAGSALVTVIGLTITIILFSKKVPGSIFIGIILTTLIGIPFRVTNIPSGFNPFSMPEAPLLFKFDFSQFFTLKFFIVFFTFFFVDIFDTIGTLVGVTTQAGLCKNGEIPRVKQAFLADAVGTAAGACLGTSTVTSYVESTAGVAQGGRTGLTVLFTSLFFFIALFLAPVFLLIPAAATSGALILVGFLMMHSAVEINFKDPSEGIPAFLTIIMMPFAYSIAEGIVWGILSFVLLKCVTLKFREISIVTFCLFVIFLARILFFV
ncbi:MAG: NCS2 family permease [Termitinemataceae bacterium]|nr:MAG: NCS2 family permease [Termitinemataceae bacterium]